MEESTTYTLQEIEKLKLKISGYRNTLMTLKMGTSFEDFQMMKNEFEALKSQLTYIEDLTKTMEEKQQTQTVIYEEQAKQFEMQIASLNKTVEKMGKEIVLISKKLNNVKEEKAEEEKNVQPSAEKFSAPKPDSTMKYLQNGTQENVPVPALPNQPSYMQLRNLANQVIQLQKEDEKPKTEEPIEYKADQVDERYFNQRYFQTINHPPHQNVSRNSLNEASLKPNKSSKGEAAFLPVLNKTSNFFEPANEPEETPPSLIKNVTKSSIESPELDEDESVVEKLQTFDLSEINEGSSMRENEQLESIKLTVEESMDNSDSGEEKTKKQWNSSFFNIFRK
ncbi:hypothetical protein MKZ25_17275 [Solibacillus sp. FSL W7-1464]|uniref:hypothetical protein n=1 Tax=Solibacillus sp. FSL W7-1464 TaxID=2921706 RepID=UPI0030FA45B7